MERRRWFRLVARLLPLREELLRRDTRPLYLGWLARASEGAFDAEEPEPPLPADLGGLTPAQQALAEFLLRDPDLIAAAAATSPEPKSPQAEESDIDAWLTTQTADALRVVLRLMLLGQPLAAERRLRGEFLAWQRVRDRRVLHRLAPAMQQLGTMQGLQPRRYGTEFLVTLPRNGGHIQQNRRSSSTERATDGSWGRKSARSRRPLVLRERPVTDLLRTPGPTTSRNNLSAPSLHQRDKPRRSAWHPTY